MRCSEPRDIVFCHFLLFVFSFILVFLYFFYYGERILLLVCHVGNSLVGSRIGELVERE